jgi:type II secretory pathway pseudopilin PulG
MINLKFDNIQRGSYLIELLITIGLAAVLLPALLVGFTASRGGRAQMEQRQKAIALAKEGSEIARVVREKDWETFGINGTYHPTILGSNWKFTAGPETTSAGFVRSITLSDVYRDTNGYITTTGGSIDPSTKKITTTVSWTTPKAGSVTTTTYLTRTANQTYTETTTADFQAGSYPHTIAVQTGDVILGPAGGGGDWCAPNVSINALDLPGQGITTAVSATYKHAYTTTGGNASGNSMDSVNITDPASGSPVATNGGSYNNYKTYGLYADPNSTRVYLTSDHPGITVDVVDGISKNQINTFNNSGGERGVSVFVSGTVGYVTAGNKLYTFDTTKSPMKELGKITLDGTGNRVLVVGQYAYIATSSTTNQLDIVNISDPKNMTITKRVSLGNGAAGVDVSVDNAGTVAYIVTANASPKADFFVVSLPDGTITGSYNTGSMNPKGVAYIPGGRAIIVGSGGEQYQVLNTTSNTPVHCGGLTNPNGSTSVNAVTYLTEPDGDVYSYILTNDANKEFQMIAGGPGGAGGTYAPEGIYTSRTFDTGHSVAFNNFSVSENKPSGTEITYKIALKPGISGSCMSVSFTSGDFVPFNPGPLPLSTIGSGYTNPGQCLKYQAILSTTDTNQTPVLHEITFNYSI